MGPQPVGPPRRVEAGRSWNRWLMHPQVRWWGRVVLSIPALALLAGVLADQLGPNPAEVLIRSTGDWALRLLCATLAVTPLRQALNLSGLAPWRRTLGLASFSYAVLHALCYAWLDMGADPQALWDDVLQRPFIWVGLSAWVVLAVLAATSPQGVARWLGGRRWRRLHQGVWLAATLVVVHFYWMRTGKNLIAEPLVYAAVLGCLLGWRFWRKWRPALGR